MARNRHISPNAVTDAQRATAERKFTEIAIDCQRKVDGLCEGRNPCEFRRCPVFPYWVKSTSENYRKL